MRSIAVATRARAMDNGAFSYPRRPTSARRPARTRAGHGGLRPEPGVICGAAYGRRSRDHPVLLAQVPATPGPVDARASLRLTGARGFGIPAMGVTEHPGPW